MNRSGWRSHLTAVLTALIACVGLLSLSTAPAWATARTVTEFPTKNSPLVITSGPDGALWFTESAASIGRITTAGKITEFPVSTTNGMAAGITAGPDGNLWFTDSGTNAIGRITPAGAFTAFRLPTHCGTYGNCEPYDITAGSDGNLWFTLRLDNAIERITPSGVVSAFVIPTANSRAEGITAGPDGNVWFCETGANQIGRITTS